MTQSHEELHASRADGESPVHDIPPPQKKECVHAMNGLNKGKQGGEGNLEKRQPICCMKGLAWQAHLWTHPPRHTGTSCPASLPSLAQQLLTSKKGLLAGSGSWQSAMRSKTSSGHPCGCGSIAPLCTSRIVDMIVSRDDHSLSVYGSRAANQR